MIHVQVFNNERELLYDVFSPDMLRAAEWIDRIMLADDDATLVVTEASEVNTNRGDRDD